MDKDNKKLDQYAKNIIKMEDDIDYSMETCYMEELMEKYIENKYQKILDTFEQIYSEQTKIRDSYGDMDYSITKVECLNIPETNERSWRPSGDFKAIQLVCHCGDDAFYIVTVTTDIGGLRNEELHILKSGDEVESTVDINLTNTVKSLGTFTGTRLEKLQILNFKCILKKPTESFVDIKMVLRCLNSIKFCLEQNKKDLLNN